MGSLSRRDFLKLSGLSTLASMPYLWMQPERKASPNEPNILILVYDAWSAKNTSLYGYPRLTTPKIDRLADRATVFHQHYASGNFTYPGTNSLLTGTYPWSHRGFSHGKGIDPAFHNRNLFNLFESHFRIGFSHNYLVMMIFQVMQNHIDEIKKYEESFIAQEIASQLIFKKDTFISMLSRDRALVQEEGASNYSLILSHFVKVYREILFSRYADLYPRGLPAYSNNYFLFEDSTNWVNDTLSEISQPYLSYFHFIPPHFPYRTSADFVDVFLNDDYKMVDKPDHTLSQGHDREHLSNLRRMYDEYVLQVDAEFNRLFSALENKGLLENTIVVLTSDHGEMFERGIHEHFHETLHQPVIQVPLLIFMPGQTERRDIHAPTSAVDLLPTLLHLTGQPVPDWIEGQVLPPFADVPADTQRAVYAVEAKDSEKYGPIDPASLMIVKNGYKLTYYSGWERQGDNSPIVELYAIKDDPEEMNNLADELPEIRDALLAEVLEKAGL